MARPKSDVTWLDRFVEGIEFTDTCWLWKKHLDRDGYGFIRVKGKQYKVHRVSYMWFNGPIPKGLGLDHLCNRANCVNPDHLCVATNLVNTRRRSGWRLGQDGVWICSAGHRVEGWNERNDGTKGCRKCHAARVRERYRRNSGVSNYRQQRYDL